MKTIVELERTIADTIQEICHVKISDENQHLLSRSLHIPTADYLYVLASLEEKLCLPVIKVLERNDNTVFTLKNFASEIYKLQALTKQQDCCTLGQVE